MKRICLIKYDMSVAGGSERVTSVLANELSKIYKIFIVSVVEQHGKCFYSFCDDVTYHVLLDSKKRMRYQLLQGIHKLKKIFFENEIDVAISIGASTNLFLIGASFQTQIKRISCEHSSLSNKCDRNIGQNISRWIGAKYADKIVTLTEQEREMYIEKYHLNRSKIHHVYNFVDNHLYNLQNKYDERSKIILTIGRIDKEKGYEMLIEIAKRILKKYPDWQWHIYGKGDKSYTEKIQSLINRNQLNNKLLLKGTSENICNVYQRSSFFISTSYYESFSLVLLEAKLNNLPTISFDCPVGPREIVQNEISGFLIEAYNIEAMTDKISKLIENSELRKDFSEHAKDNVKKFNKDDIMYKWVEIIESL